MFLVVFLTIFVSQTLILTTILIVISTMFWLNGVGLAYHLSSAGFKIEKFGKTIFTCSYEEIEYTTHGYNGFELKVIGQDKLIKFPAILPAQRDAIAKLVNKKIEKRKLQSTHKPRTMSAQFQEVISLLAIFSVLFIGFMQLLVSVEEQRQIPTFNELSSISGKLKWVKYDDNGLVFQLVENPKVFRCLDNWSSIVNVQKSLVIEKKPFVRVYFDNTVPEVKVGENTPFTSVIGLYVEGKQLIFFEKVSAARKNVSQINIYIGLSIIMAGFILGWQRRKKIL
jgi:hypothetical protein